MSKNTISLDQSWSDKKIPTQTHDLAVVIGRFQPFHNGHVELIKKAFEVAPHVLILVGSAHVPRDSRNPFTFAERFRMIEETFPTQIVCNISIQPLEDFLYNDNDWVIQVQNLVKEEVLNLQILESAKIAIVGHRKDDTSYYLDMFPEYDLIEFPNHEVLNSTTIRDIYFGKGMIPKDVMPNSTEDYLAWFKLKSEYKLLVEEHKFLVDYRSKFANYPFGDPIFVTTDAVIINNGYILLVKRRFAPGKGLWAFPGGFLKPNESIRNGLFRELEEETRIKVPAEKLRASVRESHVFDAPGRSLRGRVITHVSLIRLHERKNPKVRGTDDAVRAKWFSIADFLKMQTVLFEDHFSIGKYFINKSE